MRRRGVSLLLVIGLVAVMMMAVSSVMMLTTERYHHAQLMRDRMQALECARAGLLWAHERCEAGDVIGPRAEIDFGEVGAVVILTEKWGDSVRLTVVGTARRDSTPQTDRRLVAVWTRGAGL
jgi:type II secretory pathway component PulK